MNTTTLHLCAEPVASPSLSDEQIALLACTFGDVAQPVWIHDLKDRCLYCNTSASGQRPGPGALQFSMLSASGATLARVITRAA